MAPARKVPPAGGQYVPSIIERLNNYSALRRVVGHHGGAQKKDEAAQHVPNVGKQGDRVACKHLGEAAKKSLTTCRVQAKGGAGRGQRAEAANVT